MDYFLFFILGFICAEFVIPLIESIWAILLSLLEIPKGKATLKITKLNQEINNLTDESGP